MVGEPSVELAGEFFQLGYVTGDIDRALELYRDRYGVPDFLCLDTREFAPLDAPGPFQKIALAYKGAVMIELIEPDPTCPGIYRSALREDGGISLHHLGYLVDQDTLSVLLREFKAQGFAIPTERFAGDVSFFYADTREDVGLFSEYASVREGGRRFFDAIPRF